MVTVYEVLKDLKPIFKIGTILKKTLKTQFSKEEIGALVASGFLKKIDNHPKKSFKDTKYKVLYLIPGLLEYGTKTCKSIILKFFTQDGIDVMIANGIIEEVKDQVPEFTIDQAKAMCIAYAEHCDESLVTKQIRDPKYFNGWFNKIYTLPCLD